MSRATRTICVVTGSRAEYGLLRWVMQGIRETPGLRLRIVATGMHLAPEFGLTFRDIERDGFEIDRKVEMLLSADTPTAVTKSMGVGLIGFADALADLAPDIVLLLGDRFEILAAASAALIARIPLAHVHGGESTEGAFDDAIRHAVTKMSYLHFVAAREYRERVIQMGEHPDRVFLVGGLGIDSIKRLELLDRTSLASALGFDFANTNYLVTFHPATLEHGAAGPQMIELLSALDRDPDLGIIFTMPNADTGSRVIFEMIEDFVKTHPRARAFTSLGQQKYLSCMAQVDAVIGNSSSGLIEAPSLGIPTVNIGDRQRGRLRADSVIDCPADRDAITAAMAQAADPAFRARARQAQNPYGDGGASDRIVQVLRDHHIESVSKAFHAAPADGSLSDD